MRYIPVHGENIVGTYFTVLKLPTKNAGGKTTLEFWIGEIVSESDYEGHAIVWDGFLGEGYDSSVSLQQRTTDRFVHYTVKNYPKVDSETQGILEIEITDPEVTVYGLTTESSLEDFARVFDALGARVELYDTTAHAKLGDVWFSLRKFKNQADNILPMLTIRTDQTGIVLID